MKQVAIIVFALMAAFLFSQMAPAQSENRDWTGITTAVDDLIDQLETRDAYAPASSVVIVSADGERYIRTGGRLNAAESWVADDNSAFYIASMTKAYMGLLAARLHQQGILDLDSALTDYWPDLTFPEGRDPSTVTLRDLLTHQIPIEVDEITFLEAYAREVSPSEYPALIARYAEPREPGFAYDNLGYNIYAAILESRTGRNWRDWLETEIFTPLNLDDTSAFVSAFAEDRVAWGHRRAGDITDFWPREGDWYLLPPKTDALMQSAGGLMTTPQDMAAWLAANLAGEGPDGSGLTASVFHEVHAQGVTQEGDGDGYNCEGYALGWNICELLHEVDDGEEAPDFGRLLVHGGSYPGYASIIVVAPDMGLAVAVMTNSDAMTSFTNLEITKTVLEVAVGIDRIDARSARRAQIFDILIGRYLEAYQERYAGFLAEEHWQGWAWEPSSEQLADYAGDYRNEDNVLPDIGISVGESGLILASGGYRSGLRPATEDVFGGQSNAYDDFDTFTFIRDASGRVIAMDWDETRYERQ